MVKAVIYDLDDLMVNSLPIHVEADSQALEIYGYDHTQVYEEIESKFMGRKISDMYKEILKILNADIKLEEILQKREKIFLKLIQEKLELMPGLESSLKVCQDLNLKIALASSGTNRYIDVVLKKFDIAKYFEIIVSGDDVKKGKPDPETFSVAVKKLGLEPNECIALEDATNGIISAKAAGCLCLAVENPNTPPQDLSQADVIIDSLNEFSKELISSIDER